MADYRRGSHTVYDIRYHIIWIINPTPDGTAVNEKRAGCCIKYPNLNDWCFLMPVWCIIQPTEIARLLLELRARLINWEGSRFAPRIVPSLQGDRTHVKT